MTNVIADIAGNYKTLMALLEKMPPGPVLSVGDMVDRGPRSKEVVEYFMTNENASALMGNHEHMMIDYYRGFIEKSRPPLYASYDHPWLWNGGEETLDSYDGSIPLEVIEWMESNPYYKIINDILITHAAFDLFQDNLEEACKLQNEFDVEIPVIWSRGIPKRRPEYKMQIFGHNSHWGLRSFTDSQGRYALCVDQSRSKILTGVHLPTMQVYEQEYID